MKFPEPKGKNPDIFRIQHKNIWLRQRSEKTGSDDDTYHAATWHIPLKALLRYAESRRKCEKACFPWSMSKEDGKKYYSDRSFRVRRGDTKVANDEHYYYVAPIITDEKFKQELHELYKTPSKGQSDISSNTRSRSDGETPPTYALSSESPVSD